jgi:uncharacterized FAD-dependent dehydrogenase
MAILVTNIKLGLEQSEEAALEQAIRRIGVSKHHVQDIHLYKKSLDARKQSQLQFVVSVLLHLDLDEEKLCRQKKNANLIYRAETPLTFSAGHTPLTTPIVIAGFGPAGIFCAYTLAKAGYRPIVLERGSDVERRVQAVQDFWTTGTLHKDCNVQFGEGGAGTFSDGKLTTRISDSRCDYVLKLLHQFGAPDEILTKAKPHIGTDKLRGVIRNIREEIKALGGQVLFDHKLERIQVENGQIRSITVNGTPIKTQNLVLAIGHSARDTFSMLLKQGIFIEPKGFSVGVRIEHLQSRINEGLYGKMAGHPNLPQGEYQLSYRENGRGVYTFCMCPGGTVVPSSSSEGTVVTNGMSEYKRDGQNANSAIAVSVMPEDFGTQPLDGVRFQEALEQKAFVLGGGNYAAVGATVGDFLNDHAALNLRTVEPTYALGVHACDFRQVFPPFVVEMLKKGLLKFDRKIHGFAAEDAVLTGVETRTSSPIRITRGDNLQALGIQGLYPCGEGAGYAGGIMSAAVDGIRVAEKLITTYRPD